MNFWSFLGLASTADVHILQEELRAAREENKALSAQTIERITATSQENMIELRQEIQTLSQSVIQLRADITELFEKANYERRDAAAALKAESAEMTSKLLNVSAQQSSFEKQIFHVLETYSGHLTAIQTQMGEIVKDFERSGETLNSLKAAIQELSVKEAEKFPQIQNGLETLSSAHDRILETVKCVEAGQDRSAEEAAKIRSMADEWKQELMEAIQATDSHQMLEGLKAEQKRVLETVNRIEVGQDRFIEEVSDMGGMADEWKRELLEAIQTVNPYRMLEVLKAGQEQMMDVLSESQTALQEIPEVREYIYMLWEATKLVWVNDLLSSLEKKV